MSPSSSFSKKTSFAKLPISMIVSLVVMAVLVVGALAAVYLSQQNQEFRQQASGERAVMECVPGEWGRCGSNATPGCPSGQARRCDAQGRFGNCATPPAGTCGAAAGTTQQCGTCTTSANCAVGLTCQQLAVGRRCAPEGALNNLCSTSGGTNPTPGNVCPNPPNLPAKKYVKFTCPNGCVFGTGSDGVQAWRCHGENGGTRQDSTTPLSLNGECGQVDVLSGDTDATYCGYTDYTCGEARCQPSVGGVPSPTVPSPTPSVPVSCQGIQAVNAVTLQPLSAMPAVGQQVRFRCVPGANVGANYYFFTYTGAANQPLSLIYQGTSDLTFPITVTPYMQAQCNPCRGTECSSAQNVAQSCTFNHRAASPTPVVETPLPTPSPSPSTVATVGKCTSLTQTLVSTGLNGEATRRFTCNGVAGSNYYFFAYRTSASAGFQLFSQGNSNTATLNLPANNSYLEVQCNPCIGSSCATAQNVAQSCTYLQAATAVVSPRPSATPSPTPGPQCLSITLSNPNAVVGDTVTATCGQVAGAARYISRVQLPNGQMQDLAMTGRVSAPVQITSGGMYLFQCQICTGSAASSCMPYEPTVQEWEDPIGPPTP